jgi:methylenetetrahydrofolate reductase (NADPH)
LPGKRLRNSFREGKDFVVVAELVGGPGYNFAPMEKFLTAHKEAKGSQIPAGFDFVGVTVPQNPGGVANIEQTVVLSKVYDLDLLGGLDFIPHISCKDYNTDAMISSIVGFKSREIETVLALTGDKPVKAQGVFEVESVGLLNMIRRMNVNHYILKAEAGEWDDIHQFFAGAAVSPFKYTEASLMQQYYKMEKKITAGAEYFITQVGWDWKKSVELLHYMQQNKIDVPVLGNVYLLSTKTPAPRLMHDIKLPGCFVSDSLYQKLQSETFEEHIERAAQQVAMYKSIGAAGVDIGGVHDYKVFIKILNRADQIGSDWEKYKDNLYWPADNPFYLYDENGKQLPLSKRKTKFRERFFAFFHRAIFDTNYRGYHLFKSIIRFLGANKGRGFFYRLFNAFEKNYKYLAFECEECGDCFLVENFSYCTFGGCEKGLDNAPCGDSTVEGYCGNNLERTCIGERIYHAASAKFNGREKLRKTINQPRDPALKDSSSIINYFFGKDHMKTNALISIGEAVHASIPKTGKIMAELDGLGKDAYVTESPQLNYVRSLIESQADEGADYIAVNVDAFGEKDPAVSIRLMVEYVKLVRKWGRGVPVCCDSSNDDVLIAGLKEWYNTDEEVKKPLINSIKVYTMDSMMALKAQYDFSFIGLLVSEDKPTGPGGSHSVEELVALARTLFETAVNKYGFQAEEIFFDSTVFPLAIDMPMVPGVPGYTYRAFETIRRIKSDPDMKACHFSLGISNCCRDLPARRVGICRAYVARAMESGLDAGIVNVSHHYGQVEADPELVKLVDAFANLDGSQEKLNGAMMMMSKFCAANRKPAK